MATDDRIERDLRRILRIQAIRAFLYGFGSVILGSALAASGASDLQVGVLTAAILAGMALSAIVVGFAGDRVGRRRAYAILLISLGVVGVGYALTDRLWILIVLALFGTMSTDANENGPLTTLEQSMIGQASPDVRLTVFGRYNAVAYLAGSLGALAAGGPAFVRNLWPAFPSDRIWFLLFPVGAIACLLLSRGLSDAMEIEVSHDRRRLERSRDRVTTLASLFAIDSFAGGFVVTVFIVFWFERTFGASRELMSGVLFAAGLLQAASSIAAARVGARFGLLHTMVFTHLPSNVLLILVPLMPTLPLAIVVLLARFALSQMDVPTRQAYLAALVDPEERTAAAAATNTARYVSRPFGPIVGTLLMRIALGAPWVVAGALKSGYDLVLWRVFKKVELPA
ncbi:MAG TPA: MFS transporter [Actinomycetota bacterium]|nr:MFS transporter [Actinomycetota bacterium]